MRYAILSDIHANLEALCAALSVCRAEAVDAYLFLGDVVGYGADPRETLSLLRELKPIAVAGNHDWAAASRLALSNLNSFAREAIIWTKGRLKESDLSFLGALPAYKEVNGFSIVHGTPFEPEQFHYLSDESVARRSFKEAAYSLCFTGHTHRAQSCISRGPNIVRVYGDRVRIEEGARYLINAGSVGQPRDGDNRGCVCFYDDQRRLVIFRRFEYNIEKTADKIRDKGLPLFLAERLFAGR